MAITNFAITGAIEGRRFVKKDASNNTVSYATENGFDAIGVTENSVSSASYTAGIDQVSVIELNTVGRVKVEFAGAVTEGGYVGVGATCKSKNMPANATPVATNLVGIAQESGGGNTADSWILVNKGSYVI